MHILPQKGDAIASRPLPIAAQLIYARDLLRELVSRDMKIRYKRSMLGIAWTMINPLMQILIFTFLFNRVLPLNIPHYTVFVFCGVLAWNWFQTSLYLAAGGITENRDLVRRPGFPVAVLPVVTVATNMLHFLLSLPILLVCVLIDGLPLSPAVAALPLVLLVQFGLTLGLAYLIAATHVFFRDVQHILSIGLSLLFYLTPIFYTADRVPAEYQQLYLLNPMAQLVAAYRAIFLQGIWPDGGALLGVAIFAVAMFALGYTIFVRASYRFVEEL